MLNRLSAFACDGVVTARRYLLGSGELSTAQLTQGGEIIRIYGANFGRTDLANNQSVRAWCVSSFLCDVMSCACLHCQSLFV